MRETIDPNPPLRPMSPADYRFGDPIPAFHPTRDLVVGAVVGAVALWAVPKVLDYLVDRIGGNELQLVDDEDDAP